MNKVVIPTLCMGRLNEEYIYVYIYYKFYKMVDATDQTLLFFDFGILFFFYRYPNLHQCNGRCLFVVDVHDYQQKRN